MSVVRLALLGAGLGLAACASSGQPGGGFGPSVVVCPPGVPCRTQSSQQVTATYAREPERPTDADAYAGEEVGALRDAAAAGDARAAYKLGQAQEFGLGGAARSPSAAARSYEHAAAEGHPWATWRLSTLVERGVAPGGRRRALDLTRAAAAAGHAPSAYNLAVAYQEGRGLPRHGGEAARWMTRAAEGGVPEAQYALGTMLFRGEGVPRQSYQALQWMRSAAQGGDLRAQRAVGRLYMTGLEEMGQDLGEARSWLSLAAGRGDAAARRDLAAIDRAEREERDFQRALALRQEETRALWNAALLASWLAPPPVVVVLR
ncbi:sel1 repeat family protein [Roseomonas nepalensis]|uniref:Sel1 repeat family protein n=1 Tax=Muricoccus nepalensis TaxID=1854500 RepID=A0A502GIZ9_9PROT|nr:tetratricopeptide repeat protein [Roseomonas nepalensis]TPG61270.1 sel1 repeat family protein [Roseomonas nepalensis]